ncbi:MAG: DUF922 domain-containing protein [Pseudomonadota bacterium]
MNDTNAKVILKETTAYYSVVGKTGREIFKSMIDRGPRLGGPKGHALATTEYKYDINNVDVEIKQGRCIPVRVDVVVRVKYTYPRWAGNRGARKSTRRAWKHFEKSVVWHEKQHVKIALDYAKEYQLALKKTRLRSSQNCTATSFSTTWRATRAALKHNRRQRLFDRQDLRPGGRGYEAQLRLLKAE